MQIIVITCFTRPIMYCYRAAEDGYFDCFRLRKRWSVGSGLVPSVIYLFNDCIVWCTNRYYFKVSREIQNGVIDIGARVWYLSTKDTVLLHVADCLFLRICSEGMAGILHFYRSSKNSYRRWHRCLTFYICAIFQQKYTCLSILPDVFTICSLCHLTTFFGVAIDTGPHHIKVLALRVYFQDILHLRTCLVQTSPAVLKHPELGFQITDTASSIYPLVVSCTTENEANEWVSEIRRLIEDVVRGVASDRTVHNGSESCIIERSLINPRS